MHVIAVCLITFDPTVSDIYSSQYSTGIHRIKSMVTWKSEKQINKQGAFVDFLSFINLVLDDSGMNCVAHGSRTYIIVGDFPHPERVMMCHNAKANALFALFISLRLI